MDEIRFKSIEPSEVGAEYWELLGQRVLPFLRCQDCMEPRTYLTRICHRCESEAYRWEHSQGLGNVYACTTVHYPPTPEFTPPYVVALIELDEGVRVMANILNTRNRVPTIGDPVEVTFEELPDGKLLPQFQLVGS